MAKCTAPVRGHSSSAAAAACPVCRYNSYHRSRSSYSPSSSHSSYGSSNLYGSSSGSSTRSRPRWTKSNSSLTYTFQQIQSLQPIRDTVEQLLIEKPDLRDIFLCHAWDDRQQIAKALHDLLENEGVKVWFSEKDLPLGVPMMRAIDKGLANSRIGLVLVTPNFLKRLPQEGVADKELSALLATNQLVPILHNTTYEKLREISPLLASRTGLSTFEDSMETIAKKIAELVSL